MKVIINRGIPGSGKSTGAAALAAAFLRDAESPGWSGQAGICCADNAPGRYDPDGTYHPEVPAHAWCFKEFMELLLRGCGLIIVDNTNVSAVEMAPYVLAAQAYGAEVEIHQYDAGSIDVAHQRNTHKVPLEICVRMFNTMQQPLPSWWPKPKVVPAYADR